MQVDKNGDKQSSVITRTCLFRYFEGKNMFIPETVYFRMISSKHMFDVLSLHCIICSGLKCVHAYVFQFVYFEVFCMQWN